MAHRQNVPASAELSPRSPAPARHGSTPSKPTAACSAPARPTRPRHQAPRPRVPDRPRHRKTPRRRRGDSDPQDTTRRAHVRIYAPQPPDVPDRGEREVEVEATYRGASLIDAPTGPPWPPSTRTGTERHERLTSHSRRSGRVARRPHLLGVPTAARRPDPNRDPRPLPTLPPRGHRGMGRPHRGRMAPRAERIPRCLDDLQAPRLAAVCGPPGPAPATGRRAGTMASWAKRSYGTGSLFIKGDKWCGRWWWVIGASSASLARYESLGSREGLTRSQAERELRRRMESEPPSVSVTTAPASAMLVGATSTTWSTSWSASAPRSRTTAAI